MDRIKRVKVATQAVKSRWEIENMIMQVTERSEEWLKYYRSGKLPVKENAEALRNFTALRGVIKALRWALNELDEGESPLK